MASTVDTLLVEIRAETAQLKKGLDKVNKQLDKTKKSSGAAVNALKGFGSIVATIGLTRLAGETINTIRTFEDLEATLTAITGSAKTAALSFDLIREFTSKTTFQLEGVAEAFISLLQAGVTPTEDALKDFGNLAAAFGKDISQVAAATFRAVTGEMEMLKQFNVVAKLEGDKVRVTFGGVTKEIERNGTAIAEYLRTLGRENFPTALEDRANTLSGAISNVSDGVAEFMVSIGEGGLKDSLVTIAREMRKVLDEAKPLAEAIGAVLGTAVNILGKALLFVIDNFQIFLALIMAKAFTMLPVAIGAASTASLGLASSLLKVNVQLASMTKFLKASKLTVLLAAVGLFTVPLYNWATAEEEVNEELDDTIDKSAELAKALAKPAPFMDRLGKKTKETLKFLQEFGNVTKTTDQKIREFADGGMADLEKMASAFVDEKFEIAFKGFIGPIDDRQFRKDMRDSFFKDTFNADEDTVMKRIGLMPIGEIQGAVKEVASVINKELDPNGIKLYQDLLNDETALADFFALAGKEAAFFGKDIDEVKAILQKFVNDALNPVKLTEAEESLKAIFNSGADSDMEVATGIENIDEALGNLHAKLLLIDEDFLKSGISVEQFVAQYNKGIDSMSKKTEDLVPTLSGELKDAITQTANAFSNEFVDSLAEGQGALESFKDFSDNIVKQIISIFIQLAIVNRILNNIFGANTFDQFSFKGGFESATERKTAGGGAAFGSQAMLVGERGPEIFVPHSNGNILNNMNSKKAIGGGGTTVINQSINFATGIVPTVRAEVTKMMPQIADVTKAAVQEAAMRGGTFRRSLQGG
jgi:hypothetical protein